MKSLIILGVISIITILAIVYVVKSKRKGKACIGCPCSGGCSGSCHKK